MEKLLKRKDLQLVGATLVGALASKVMHLEFVIAILVAVIIIVLLSGTKLKRWFKRAIGIIAIILVMVCAILFHSNFCNEKEEASNEIAQEVIVEEEPEVEDQPEEKAETTEVESQSSSRRPYITDAERKAAIDMEVTYGGEKNTEDEAVKEQVNEVVVGNTTTEFTAESSEEQEDYKEEIEEAIEEGKDVNVENDGETTSIVDTATEEEKEEINNSNGSTDANWEDLLNSSNVTVQKPAEDNKVEAPVAEDNKVEDNKVEMPVKEDNKVEDNKAEMPVEEDNKVETPVEDETEVVEQIKVNAIDGYETVVGSTIQFDIEGATEDLTIEGLDGIDYTLNGNILNISVGNEATVLTVNISDSNSNVMFDITVNGIIG